MTFENGAAMSVKEYVSVIKRHMKAVGWLPAGFDGQWALMRKNTRAEDGSLPPPIPLPDAVVAELEASCVMWPFIEQFLTQNGWTHYSRAVSGTTAAFHRIVDGSGKIEHATLPRAFKLQLEKSVLGS